MKTCIIQLDETSNNSFVWGDSPIMLLNIMKTIYPHLEYDQFMSGDDSSIFIYLTIDYLKLHNMVSLVFDKIIVDVSEEYMGDLFHEQCLKKMELLNENT